MEVENYPKWKDTKGRVITPKSEDQKSSSKKKDVSGVAALSPNQHMIFMKKTWLIDLNH